ncbi:hypothetical protein CAFEA_09530 [Corynebacterium afermentans subsp. afermentans]|uniref:Uncharacterized protein n=1 Tax=Corynebacterium afermentans TaxID=38286 RepID=A0A9X8WH60_9CORY|nr:hypothetical protein [Corynebacterium afermentans]OAA15872.1 hypothetical protein Caferm_04250 [Corynebacterium afermentans subsp. afermentans]WJY57475.1 hypothetical protein CAFEA_09530 [Corynebacterium afermentans subsp. afermentans]SIQ10130.1 hypothetical protein SAMN05421802_10658 [Corynebacterium afermentans]
MYRPTRAAAVATAAAAALLAVPVAATAEDLPAETTDVSGEQYFLNEEGSHYVRTLQEAAQPYVQLDSGQQERAVAVADAAVAGLIGSGVVRDQPSDQPTGEPVPTDPETTETPAEAPAETPVEAPSPDNAPEEPLGAEDVNPASDDPVAHGLVEFPPVLTLDGKTFFLNKDGHTFVADVARVNADVTPEETADSNAMIQANAGEIGRQGLEAARAAGKAVEAAVNDEIATPYAAPARGMEAETGSNTVARALFALVLASVLGAGFFAFARRRLV